MKAKDLCKLIRVFLFLVFLHIQSNVMAQDQKMRIQQERETFLSKKYNLTSSQARSIIVLMDSTTKAMNKVFHDPNLTSAEKIKRLKALEEGKSTTIRRIIPDKADIFLSPMVERKRTEN